MPEDPNLLLSYVNLKLRDYYSSLEDLCEDLDASASDLETKLMGIGYHYDRGRNQFTAK